MAIQQINKRQIKESSGATTAFITDSSVRTYSTTSIVDIANTTATITNAPTGFFTTVQSAVASIGPNGQQYLIHNGAGPTNISFIVQNQQSSIANGEYVVVYAIGS